MDESEYTILVLEDDPNDVLLLKRAFKKNDINYPVFVAQDGEQGLAYLKGEGEFSDRKKHPFPKVIILDLKMPKVGGMEVLRYLQENPRLRVIPTIVLSASEQDLDVARAYDFGANTYMVKPGTFDELVTMVKVIHSYWTLAMKPEADR